MEYCKCIVTIVCSLSHAHFGYIDFLHVFEHFSGLNVAVIIKIIMTVWNVFLLRRTFTEQLRELQKLVLLKAVNTIIKFKHKLLYRINMHLKNS